ncbi:MAG: TnpV protein [Lachnospiraceae bacterium]|nr:TnpV protein [Lachnospiraceae bacterium]
MILPLSVTSTFFFILNVRKIRPTHVGRRSGRIFAHIDKQAQERFEMLGEQMKQAQRVTEQLKEENDLEWVGQLNDIRACARKIVNSEIVYV